MSVPTITYEDFQKTPQAFTDYRGPWTGAINPVPRYSYFISSNAQHCGGACLQIQITVPDGGPVLSVSYSANIAVDMSKYGNANTLDFTWTYWPIFTAKNALDTDTFPIRTQINSVVFDDASAGATFGPFYYYHVWTGSLISHSGTTTVNRGADNIGYISVVISFSTTSGGTSGDRIDQFTKDISFKITTPTQSATPNSNSSAISGGTTRPVSGSASGSASGSGLLPLPTISDGLSQGPPSGSSSGSSPSQTPTDPNTLASQSAKMSTGEIGGIVVGGIALLALLVILFVVYRGKKNKKRLASWEQNEAAPTAYPHEKDENMWPMSVYTHRESPELVYTIPMASVSHSPSGDQALLPGSSHSPASHEPPISTANYTRPPIYDNAPVDEHYDYVQPAFPALSRWANANRALISQDLEARLEAAGYLPTDNPDNLSEEEWITEHNVTKLEVMRIRALYQAGRQGDGTIPV